MKIIAWNVNGLRATMTKNHLIDLIEKEQPTIICFGETKLTCPITATEKMMEEKIPGYKYRYYSTCNGRGGYSGTAIFSKKKPVDVIHGLGHNDHDGEGRLITLEFKKFFLVHVYTPNSGQALARLKYRVEEWDVEFRKFLHKLQNKKPIIVCGDLNVANEDIDIHDPKGNKKSAGFTDEERESFKKTLTSLNLIDTFRYKHPLKVDYSYWSYRMNSRAKNKGWRIDYFLVSHNIINKVTKSKILTEVHGSDHAPVKMNITFKE
jgi:exodeoxyribonuclease-3